MKSWIAGCTLVMLWYNADAQNFFNQQGASIKNLARQVALLYTYTVYLQKGYAIAKDGLGNIGDLKNTDLELHTRNFNGLTNVAPAVAADGRVQRTAHLLQQLAAWCNRNKAIVSGADRLLPAEAAYVHHVFSGLLQKAVTAGNELHRIVHAGGYQMTDAARLAAVDALYAGVVDTFRFARVFLQDIGILQTLRLKELRDIQRSRDLHALQNLRP